MQNTAQSTLTFSPRDFIQEICREENIGYTTLSQDYIVRLTKGSITRHVLWSNWDTNNAAADRIACDKTACYEVMNLCGVPAIPHVQLLHPLKRQGWTGEQGTWTQTLKYFRAHGQKVVLKPNNGTNGRHVYLCDTVQTLEAAVHAIFVEYPDAAISPFYDIKTEYRVFYVNGNCPLAYGKRPDEENWRHNLSQGAKAFELTCENEQKKLATLHEMASCAAKAIGINFATIDVVELANGNFMVMEINSGVQARQLLEQMPHLRPTVKGIYAQAVLAMFEGK